MTEEQSPDPAFVNDFNENIIAEFRANDGKVGGQFANANLLLLHTTGAKSGQPRISPLAYFRIDGKLIIIGSFAGAPVSPAWVHNLRANPQAHVEIGTECVRRLRPASCPPTSAPRCSTKSPPSRPASPSTRPRPPG